MLEHWAAAKPARNHAAQCEKLRRTLVMVLRHLIPASPCGDQTHGNKRKWRGNIPHIYSPADARRMP